MHTDLKVAMYWGEMGVDFWDADIWNKEVVEKHEVSVFAFLSELKGLLIIQTALHNHNLY